MIELRAFEETDIPRLLGWVEVSRIFRTFIEGGP